MTTRRPFRLNAITIAILQAAQLYPQLAQSAPPAGATAANANTTVYLAPNGVPVVNIANPNGAGLSHNQDTQFNVDCRGLELNNGTSQQLTQQSQLAGQLIANVQLSNAAKVILNEVVSPNRSLLAGYTEVVGNKADVIIANPFGITCNGCGFINTDRATLSTGTPTFAADGSLAGLRVTSGDVAIDGAGIDARNQRYFDIVARSVTVNGQVNAQLLNIATGANLWNYATQTATPLNGADVLTGYAFDSTLLGGMYANSIRIIATDAGVGVRMLGDAAASAADFNIDAAGNIALNNHISAQRDVVVSYNGAANSNALQIGGANSSLSAKNNILLAANGAGITLTDATLSADNNFTLAAAMLSDNSASNNIGNRYAGANLAINVDGASNVNGSRWGAGGSLSATTGTLQIGSAGATFYSGANSAASDRNLTLTASSGDLNLGTASVKTPGDIVLTAQHGSIDVAAAAAKGVQAGNDLTLTAANALTNAGNLLAARNIAVQAASAQPLMINNSGQLQAGNDLTVHADTDIANSGHIVAARDIELQALSDRQLTIANHGLLQAGNNLTLLANTDLTNTDTVLAGNNITLQSASAAASNVDNSGLLQAGNDVTLNADTHLNNSGDLLAAHNITLQASSPATLAITNSGQLQAGNDLTLTANANVTNNHNVLAGHNITLQSANAGTLMLTNNGQLQAANQLAIGGSGQTVNIDNTSNGTLIGDTLQIAAHNIVNNKRIQAAHGLTINADSLDNQNANAVILAATANGASTINIGGTLRNAGLIHSLDNLNINAGTLNNTNSAGLSSLKTLALTSSSGGIINSGSIFAVQQLNVTTNGQSFINNGTVAAGTPGSGSGGMLFNVDTFTNNNTMTTEGDLVINTRNFYNNPTGGLPTIVTLSAALDPSLPVQTVQQCVYNTGSSYICGPVQVVDLSSLTPIAVDNYVNCDLGTHNNCAQNYLYQLTYTVDQQLVGNMPTPGNLLAKGSFQLNYSGEAKNTASVISGNSVYITGANGSSTFENSDFHLEQQTYVRRIWIRSGSSGGPITFLFGGPFAPDPVDGNEYFYPTDATQFSEGFNIGDNAPGDWTKVSNYSLGRMGTALDNSYSEYISGTVTASQSAGVFSATLLTYHGPGINNQAGTKTKATTHNTPTSVTPLAPGQTVPVPSIPGLDLTLPSNPNGFFVPSKNPQSNYLVETNPLYSGSNLLGSDYLAQLLGYNIDTLEKRLGDANYEAKLIRDQLIAQTGNNILKGYANEGAQLQGLMENASAQDKQLGLVFGKALTPAQAANLTQDLVWMVEQDVNGQKVLAPVVYLAAKTRDSIVSGAVMVAADIDIHGNTLTNTNGTIKADNTLNVKTSGDIVNTSGAISGGDVNLKSESGSIRNETSARTGGDDTYSRTQIGDTATISATKNLSIDAKQDVIVKGADIKAGDSASISAGRNVSIDTIENKTADTSGESSSSGFMSDSSTTTNIISVKQIGSNVQTGKNLSIKSGNDITVGGSKVNAGGDANIDAANNLNIVDRQDRHSVNTETHSGGLSTDGASVSYDKVTEKVQNTKTTSVGSSITSAGNTQLKAGDTVSVKGSDVDSAGNLDVSAKNISVTAGENTDATHSTTHTQSVGIGAQADANSYGVSVSHTTSDEEKANSSSTARTSSLKAGGNMTRTATGTITDQGTQIEAGGDFKQSAKTIDMLSAENKQSSSDNKSSEKISVGYSVQYGAGDAVDGAKKGDPSAAVSAAGGPTMGVDVNYQKDKSGQSSSASQAVVTQVKAGGKISSSSSGTTTMEGTQLQSRGDTELSAKTLNATAAHDTASEDKSSNTIKGGARVNVDVTMTPGATLSGGYSDSSEHKESSNAVTGAIKSGGNLSIKTQDDANFEGTQLSGKGDTTVDAGGNVNMKAAHNTASANASSLDASGSISVGKSNASAQGSIDTKSSSSSSSDAVAGSVSAGNNLTIKSGKDTHLEGTDLTAGKDAKISAGGAVDMKAATSTSEAKSSELSASISLQGDTVSKNQGKSKDGKAATPIGGGSISGSDSSASSTTQKGSNIKTGGNLTIESNDKTTLQGTQADVGGKATIDAKAGVVKQDAVSESSSSTVGGGVSVVGGKREGGSGGAVGGTLDVESTHSKTSTAVDIHEKGNTTETAQ